MTTIFTAAAKDFAAGVNAAIASLPGRAQPPIMGAMVIDTEADDAGITLSTFDWDKSTSVITPATSIPVGTRVAVSGRLLAQVVKVMPKQPVQADVDGTTLTLTVGKTTFTLPTMHIDEYPDIPVVDDVIGEISGPALVDTITRVARSAKKERDAITGLNCLYLVSDGNTLVITATDTYRLTTVELPWTPVSDDVELNVCIDAEDLIAALRPLSESSTVSLRRSARSTLFGFSAAGIASTVSVYDGDYPAKAWPRLFPDKLGTIVDVNGEFVESVKRIAAVSTSPHMMMSLSADTVALSVAGEIVDEAEFVEFVGDERVFKANASYLLNALASFDGPVRMGFPPVELGNRPMTLHAADGEPSLDDPSVGGTRVLLMGIRS